MYKHLFFILFFSFPLVTIAQSIATLEEQMEKSYGKEKLELLLQLAEKQIQSDPKEAVKNARQANEMAIDIIQPNNTLITKSDFILKPKSYFVLGKAYFEREQYLESKNAFNTAKEEFAIINHPEVDTEIEEYLSRINAIAKEDEKAVEGTFLKKTLGNIKIGELINETTDDVSINTVLKVAESHEKKGDYIKAISSYQKAINLLRNKGESLRINELRVHIGDLYVKAIKYDEALDYYSLARQDFNKMNEQSVVDQIDAKIADILAIKKAKKSVPIRVQKNLNNAGNEIQAKIDSIETSQESTQEKLKILAEKIEKEEDYEKSLEYYKLYTELQTKYADEERAKEIAILDQERIQQEVTLLKQDQEISRLQIAQNETDLLRQKKFRNNLIIGAILLLALAIALYLLYKNKKRDHQKLQVAYQELDQTKSQLETAEKKIKTLLQQQVSGAVATALLKEEISDKIEERFVCVMFLDIRDFTPFAETKKPEEIIQYQNDVFGFMIDIVEQHHGVINQLLGDGFMATFGAPLSHGNDCQHAINAAKDIVHKLQGKVAENSIPKTKVGIGLHAGNVVTGNVGTEERKQYSITGNTVIIAARIEQLTKQMNAQVLISKEVYEQLTDFQINGQKFSQVNIKGRNEPIEVLTIA